MRKQAEVPMATQDSLSLYERLGGIYSIATVVDDLIDRVMADPRLNANPLVDDAHHKVPPAGFKYLVIEMLCWAAGGPQKYTGKDMESSHRHLRITPGEWARSWTTWRRRSTNSQSRRPSGPRSWPSSRAPGARSSPPNKRRLAGRHARINMERIGTVETICRYPVKSMAGEDVAQAFVGFAGLMGDRAFAFVRTPGPKGFPGTLGASRRIWSCSARISVRPEPRPCPRISRKPSRWRPAS